jgi:superoxide dismutase, Fe-Mn family
MKQEGNNSRRKFITDAAKTAALVTIGSSTAGAFLTSCSGPKAISITDNSINKFSQALLPYAYDALENVIDAKTMEIHYSKHAAGYSKNLIDEIASLKPPLSGNTITLSSILGNISVYTIKMRNNAGGHYNHELFWQCMRPLQIGNKAGGNLQLAIDKAFGSFDEFKKQFAEAGKTRFGSGWAWLYVDAKKNLKIGSTPNQDNPLMDVSDIKGFPLLALDVWEHAYYLKYQNKRADYIENWWQVVNWQYVERRFALLPA